MEPASFIKSQLDRAKQDKKKLLVYVGATWCEPCQRFHKAAEAGELDTVFPDLRFIDLDDDADASVIAELGCASRLIPLFAIPDANGHCTERRVEGGIKGDGAVGYMSPRLRALVGPIE
jgi:thiol-disulfide isomerase/thioredoxin